MENYIQLEERLTAQPMANLLSYAILDSKSNELRFLRNGGGNFYAAYSLEAGKKPDNVNGYKFFGSARRYRECFELLTNALEQLPEEIRAIKPDSSKSDAWGIFIK